ncbi:hypothetical protein Tco_0778636 [Tanacetum coccineum]
MKEAMAWAGIYHPSSFGTRPGVDGTRIPLASAMARGYQPRYPSMDGKSRMMASLPGLTYPEEISRWWEVNHRDVDSFDDWREWLKIIWLPLKVKDVFEGICAIVWWYTRNWRNKKIFGIETPSKAYIFDEIVSRSFHWVRSRSKASFSWNEWLKNPNLISL